MALTRLTSSRRLVPAGRDAECPHARRLERPLRAARRPCLAPTVEALREKVAARLAPRAALPPAARVPAAAPGGAVLGRRPAFDVAAPRDRARRRDATRVAGPVPRAHRRGAVASRCDRDRPLWHIYLVPRLEDGRVGLLFKIHHALVDGKSAVELALLLFDTDARRRARARSTSGARRPRPNAARLALDAFASSAAEPLRAARGMARMAGRRRARRGLTGTLRRAALAFEQRHAAPGPVLLPERADRPAARARPPPRPRCRTCVAAKQRAGVTRQRRLPGGGRRRAARAGARCGASSRAR